MKGAVASLHVGFGPAVVHLHLEVNGICSCLAEITTENAPFEFSCLYLLRKERNGKKTGTNLVTAHRWRHVQTIVPRNHGGRHYRPEEEYNEYVVERKHGHGVLARVRSHLMLWMGRRR